MNPNTTIISAVTCPSCGYTKEEQMHETSCVYFYECNSCKKMIRPKPGDCCVFCSYGTVKCPSAQAALNKPKPTIL